MIISRTPFRISFFGGGTDFPLWYKENTGAVLSTTIDKYCYISCRYLPPFFDHKHRIVYSKNELVTAVDEIVHPSVRETFRYMNIDEGIELHHDGDLPARSGLGSSSSFTVGLLHALYALKGKMISKMQLALESIDIEQNIIKENVGSQDQVAVAFGGMNKITFSGEHEINVIPITISEERKTELQNNLMLFYTGLSRFASDIEKEKISQIRHKHNILQTMYDMVDEAINILNGKRNLTDFGKMLNESWKLKRSLSDKVSSSKINDIYEKAMKHGAVGGKLLGAGGGGFILFYVESEKRERVLNSLKTLLHVPFKFDTTGSQLIYYSESKK